MNETLENAKADLFRILDEITPGEIQHMLWSVRNGRIDGSTYVPFETEEDTCGCLIGAILEARDSEDEDSLDFVGNDFSPIEDYIYYIRPGKTPANSPIMRNVEAWIIEWQATHESAVQS